jgi:hypothetical protein
MIESPIPKGHELCQKPGPNRTHDETGAAQNQDSDAPPGSGFYRFEQMP